MEKYEHMPRKYLERVDLLIQLAEEAGELAAAASKFARVIRGTNPTPVTYRDALVKVLEEVTDVQVVLGETLSISEWEYVAQLRPQKLQRWMDRLEEDHAANDYI